jgi:hypothetical protein
MISLGVSTEALQPILAQPPLWWPKEEPYTDCVGIEGRSMTSKKIRLTELASGTG